MALLDLLEAAQVVAKGVSGIQTAYRLIPEKPPTGAMLPAVIQTPVDGDIAWVGGLEIWTHRWNLDVLVARAGDVQGEYAAVLPYLASMVAAFRTNSTLGLATVYACQPVRYEVLALSAFGETYAGIRLSMTAKEKFAASFS